LQNLAEKVGTTAQTIQRLETDNMSVSVDWLHRIAPALGVDPSLLLDATSPVRSVRYLGELGIDCVIKSVRRQHDGLVPIDIPGKDPVAVRLTARLGPYETGTLLIADKLDREDHETADGRDCLVELQGGPLLFRRIVAGRDGLTALVPYEAAGNVDRNLRLAWIAPILMSIRYL
jgi:transcriptional regulator with XRE-family HTH domain